MAENSKGKRSENRRSSILKRVLADIDVNKEERTEVITRSKRVSFADVCCVQEFPRDSPQLTAQLNDSSTFGDTSLQDADGNCPSNQVVEPPMLDKPAGSGFLVDDGDSTFIGGPVRFESTRAFDSVDNNMFGGAGGLDVSAIVQGENGAFVPAPPLQNTVQRFISNADSLHSTISHPIAEHMNRDFSRASNTALQQMPVVRREINQTIVFDDQDSGTMDLTCMDITRTEISCHPSPKFSARDFLNKLKAGNTGQVFGVHQVREEQTIVFSNVGAMNLTENPPPRDTVDFKFAPQPFMKSTEAEEKAFSFGDAYANDKNIALNLDGMERPKTSAKSFLASLQGNKESASTVFSVSPPSSFSRREDDGMTMEMTCVADASKPIIQSNPSFSRRPDDGMTMEMTCVADASKPIIQSNPSFSRRPDDGMTMEMTCVADASKPIIQSNPSFSRRPDDGMTMEMTCVADASKPIIQSNPSFSRRPDDGMTMELTCVADASKPIIQSNPSFSRRPDDGMTMEMTCVADASKPIIQSNPSFSRRPDDGMTMEMTCVADASKLIIQSNPSFSRRPDDGMTMEMTCVADASKPIIQSNPSFSRGPDDGMTMEMTCVADVSKPIIQSNPSFSRRPDDGMTMEMTCVADASKPIIQSKPRSSEKEEDDMTMEMTCTDLVSKEVIQMANSNTSQLKSLPGSQSMQQGTLDVLQNEDVTGAMELTGCLDNMPQLHGASSVGNEDKGKTVQMRNALVDITASYSTSPVQQPAVKVEKSCSSTPVSSVKPGHTVPISSLEQGHMSVSALTSGHQENAASQLTEQENGSTQGNLSEGLDLNQRSKVNSMVLVQEDNKASVASITSVSGSHNITCDHLQEGCKSSRNRSVLLSADKMETTMDLTDVFVENTGQLGENRQTDNFNQSAVKEQEPGALDSLPSVAKQRMTNTVMEEQKSETSDKDLVSTSNSDTAVNQNTGSCVQDKDGFGKGMEENWHDTFNNREPTTLMEMTGILKNIRKQIEGQMEEKEVENKTCPSEDKAHCTSLIEQHQPKSETVNFGASRKLRLSSTVEKSHMLYMRAEKGEDSTLPRSNRKHKSHSSDSGDDEPLGKIPRFSDQTVSEPDRVSMHASEDQETFRRFETGEMEKCNTGCKTVESVSVASKNKSDILPRLQSSGSSSSEGNSTQSSGIFAETMPVIASTSSNASYMARSSTSMMSTSLTHNSTGSILFLGRSFIDKQDKNEQLDSFKQTCEQLGISRKELTAWVCRRSSVFQPNVDCNAEEAQPNLMSVVKRECESKAEFVECMAKLIDKEEPLAEELEANCLRQIAQANLVEEAAQFPDIKKQVRSLFSASRKHAQALWKMHKADMLCTLAQNMENYRQTVAVDIQDMTTHIEAMVTLREKVDQNINGLQVQLDSLRTQVSSRKQKPRHLHEQQDLEQQRKEQASLNEQVSEAKSSTDRLQQKEADLQAERDRIKKCLKASADRQQQLMKAHDTLSTLHCLHCWRLVRAEKQKMDFMLLHDSVLLSVALDSGSSEKQPLSKITVSSRLKEGSEPWAVLASELTVDTITACCQHLLNSYPTTQHLHQLLDEVTEMTEDIKCLCREVKLAFVKYHVTVSGKRVTAEVWNKERLQKVSLTTDIPVSSYPHHPLSWQVEVVMGDISETAVQKAITEVESGRNHLTRVLQTVHCLLKE